MDHPIQVKQPSLRILRTTFLHVNASMQPHAADLTSLRCRLSGAWKASSYCPIGNCVDLRGKQLQFAKSQAWSSIPWQSASSMQVLIHFSASTFVHLLMGFFCYFLLMMLLESLQSCLAAKANPLWAQPEIKMVTDCHVKSGKNASPNDPKGCTWGGGGLKVVWDCSVKSDIVRMDLECRRPVPGSQGENLSFGRQRWILAIWVVLGAGDLGFGYNRS